MHPTYQAIATPASQIPATLPTGGRTGIRHTPNTMTIIPPVKKERKSINYDYLQRYLLEFNLRYDGSSRFPVGKKWAFFPSVSAGWRASEEKFMDWTKPVLSNFKLRASWGTIGNQDVAAYAYLPIMAPQNSGWVIDGKNVLHSTRLPLVRMP